MVKTTGLTVTLHVKTD